MAEYPDNTAEILTARNYDPDTDFSFSLATGNVENKLRWFHFDPKPTAEQVIAWGEGDSGTIAQQRTDWRLWREKEWKKGFPVPINPSIIMPTSPSVMRQYYFNLAQTIKEQSEEGLILGTDKKLVFDIDRNKYEIQVSTLYPVLVEYNANLERIETTYLEALSELYRGNPWPVP